MLLTAILRSCPRAVSHCGFEQQTGTGGNCSACGNPLPSPIAPLSIPDIDAATRKYSPFIKPGALAARPGTRPLSWLGTAGVSSSGWTASCWHRLRPHAGRHRLFLCLQLEKPLPMAKFGMIEGGILLCALGALWAGLDKLPGKILLLAATILIGSSWESSDRSTRRRDAYELFQGWLLLAALWISYQNSPPRGSLASSSETSSSSPTAARWPFPTMLSVSGCSLVGAVDVLALVLFEVGEHFKVSGSPSPG